jgi:hypothetical protein
MAFESYHIYLLLFVGYCSKFSQYILIYHFVDKYFQTTFPDTFNPILINNIHVLLFAIVILFDILFSFISLCLYFYNIKNRHKTNEIHIGDESDNTKSFEILLGIREEEKESGKKILFDKIKIYREEFKKSILKIHGADKKLKCKLKFVLIFDTD